jgi:antitoxin MazE
MEIRIQKWGNSDGIRIPRNILKSLNIKTNDILNIEEVNKKIIISIPEKKKVSLEEKFKEYKGKNLSKEFSWDESVGKEIW